MTLLSEQINLDDDYVSSEWIFVVIVLANAKGIRVDALFELAGLQPELSIGQNDVITVSQLDVLLENLFGETSQWSEISSDSFLSVSRLLSNLTYTASSAVEAFQLLFNYRGLYHPFLDFTLEDSVLNDDLVFVWANKQNSALATKPYYFEMFAAVLANLGLSLCSQNKLPVTIYSQARESDYLSYLAGIVGFELKLSAKRNCIQFERSVFQKPLLSSLPSYHQQIEQRVRQRLAQWPKRASYQGRVLELLSNNVGANTLNMDFVCEGLGVNRRTLQRRLKTEGVNFQELLDSVRFRYAKKLLETSELDVVDISNQLGYSEPSAFYQAFKRWSGVSPGDYRERKHQADSLV